jgi:beta-RFAP synthase
MTSPTTDAVWELTTGSRLHFGLYQFAPRPCQKTAHPGAVSPPASQHALSAGNSPAPTSFGGVGMMIQEPAVKLRLQPANRLSIQNDSTGRIQPFVQRWFDYVREATPQRWDPAADFTQLPAEITLLSCPPQHNGLGAGTQLALAVGQILTRRFLSVDLTPVELARSVGRGLRSAVGTHGFFRGGLIVDRGKPSPHELGILDGAWQVPPQWRVVLILQQSAIGLHGAREIQAFQALPEIPPSTTAHLQHLTRNALVPAIAAADFATFADAIYEYGLTAGQCFTQVQGGPFASPAAAAWVERLRGWGILGVGQSSWGPTLFAFTADAAQADWLQQKIHSLGAADIATKITAAQAGGFTLR